MVTRGEPENAERSGRLKYPSSPLPFICVYSFRDYRKFLSDTVVGCSLDEKYPPPCFYFASACNRPELLSDTHDDTRLSIAYKKINYYVVLISREKELTSTSPTQAVPRPRARRDPAVARAHGQSNDRTMGKPRPSHETSTSPMRSTSVSNECLSSLPRAPPAPLLPPPPREPLARLAEGGLAEVMSQFMRSLKSPLSAEQSERLFSWSSSYEHTFVAEPAFGGLTGLTLATAAGVPTGGASTITSVVSMSSLRLTCKCSHLTDSSKYSSLKLIDGEGVSSLRCPVCGLRSAPPLLSVRVRVRVRA